MSFKKIYLGVSMTFLLVLAGCSNGPTADYSEFAQCLSDEEIVMYGAFWCPHCADQKEMFGDAWDNITYVECDPNGEEAQPELCLVKGVDSYPTWIRSDGERLSGTQTFEQLEEFSTCTLPVEAHTAN